jgi:hypothetical protein
MHLRNSPLAKSPPKNLPTIPGVTSPQTGKENKPIDKSSVNVITTTIVEEKPLPTNPISTAGDYFLV